MWYRYWFVCWYSCRSLEFPELTDTAFLKLRNSYLSSGNKLLSLEGNKTQLEAGVGGGHRETRKEAKEKNQAGWVVVAAEA